MNDNKNNHQNYLSSTVRANRLKQIALNQDFFDLIPQELKIHVFYIIEKEFNGDAKAYRETVPLFEKLFQDRHLLIANNVINKKSEQYREKTKQRREYLLWACQLLKLVGSGRGGALPLALVNEYKASQEAQEAFIAGHRLIGLNGKVHKLSTTKRKQRNAQIYRITKTMDRIADDSGFTFSFVTLTLPPEYHPNPKFGKCSYSGKTPSQAKEKLNKYWELIRANLAKAGLKVGDDFFGMQVNEAHKDSTLHKHLVIYHSKKNIDLIHQVIGDVEHREKQAIARSQGISIKKVKFHFDIKLNNGKAKASTYLFKYICKSLDDKETLVIEACRSFYSARAFNYFGMDGKINAFNHLCSNYKSYESVLTQQLVEVFETRDLYSFIKNHKDNFKTVSKDDVFLGFAYEEHGDITLIEKRQYCLFEYLDAEGMENKDILKACKDKNKFNMKNSYSALRDKADKYIDYIDDYLNERKQQGFNVVLKDGSSMSSDFYTKRVKELDKLERDFNNSFNNALVTVNLHYSSKTDFQSFLEHPIWADAIKKRCHRSYLIR